MRVDTRMRVTIGNEWDGTPDRNTNASANPRIYGPHTRKVGAIALLSQRVHSQETGYRSLLTDVPVVRYTGVMKVLTWPTLDEDHQWLTAALEKDLLESNQTPEELRAEAQRVRAEAEQADVEVVREALLTLAANFESVAADRLAA